MGELDPEQLGSVKKHLELRRYAREKRICWSSMKAWNASKDYHKQRKAVVVLAIRGCQTRAVGPQIVPSSWVPRSGHSNYSGTVARHIPVK